MRLRAAVLFLAFLLFLPIVSGLVFSDSPQPKILLVRDAHNSYIDGVNNPNEFYGKYYDNALQANDLKYTNYTVQGATDSGPSSGTMEKYDIVIWFTGDDYGGDSGKTLTETDRSEISTYLDNGGRLFLSGQDIGYDIGTSDFYEDYLHAVYCDDDANDDTLSGESNNPIGDGLLIDISGGAGNQEYPSLVWHDGSTLSDDNIFAYKTGKSRWYKCDTGDWYWLDDADLPGAVKADTGGPSGYKVAYFAFGFEGIDTSSKRQTVMNRVIDYLRGPKTKNAKVYPKNLDNSSYTDVTVSCDADDPECLREINPKLNASCKNYQLFANVNGAEYRSTTGTTSIQAVDGSFDEDIENVKSRIDPSDYISSTDEKTSFKFSVRCQDTDNYWGRYDNLTFYFDRRKPSVGALNISKIYVSNQKPSIEINLDYPDLHPAHFMRFSCNKTNWTSWRSYPSGGNPVTYSNFNITNSQAGCDTSDGNRTVYLQTRDRAGNLRNYTGYEEDWVVLDTEAPNILSINPDNTSYLSTEENVTINASDSRAGIDRAWFYNSNTGENETFTVNQSFDPGWVDEGVKELRVWINDSVGNVNYSTYRFKVDTAPPSTSDNTTDTWTSKNQTIDLDCSDSDSTVSGCNVTMYCVNSTANPTCDFNEYDDTTKIEVGCVEGEACEKRLYYYSSDTVNNTEAVKKSTNKVKVDKKAPSVILNEPPSSYVKGSIQINATVVEGNVSMDEVLYNLSNSSWSTHDSLSQSGNNWPGSYDTAQISDGEYNVTILANDTLGNLNDTQRMNISVDNTPPSTNDNITSAWRSSNKTVNLTCSDNGVGCDTILYCLDSSGTCSPNQKYTSPFNVTCPQSDTCEKYVRYKSNDTLGNEEDINSPLVKIDKEAPQITIDNPGTGTYAGIIDLRTTITDRGIGVNRSWYQALNASDLSEFASGSLNSSGGWDTTWNSTQNISKNETSVFNISANDTLGNTIYNVNVTFEVDNRKPSTKINFPDKEYLNQSFGLDLVVEATGSVNISYAVYNISNSTWNKTNSTNVGINVSSYSFTNQINIDSWSDGKYNLSLKANNTQGLWGEGASWFVLDRIPPTTSDDTNSEALWYASDQVVNLTCYPGGGVNASCDATLHDINSTTSYTLNKTSTLFEVSCPNGETCEKQVVYKSNDTAGNLEDLKTSNLIRIDKEAPNTTDNTSSAEPWHLNNVTVNLSASDEGIGVNATLYCVDTTGTCTPDRNYTSPVEVGCSSGQVCKKYVGYKSNDSLGHWESVQESNLVKIDKAAPTTSDNTSSAESWHSQNQSVKLSCTDQGSSCDTKLYCINSSGSCDPSETYTSPAEVGCVGGQSCQKQVVYHSNDSVGNLEDNKTSHLIRIDKEAPETWNYQLNISQDENYGDRRIYPGDAIKFTVNISDARNVSWVKVNLSKPLGYQEKVLSLDAGDKTNGTWSFVHSPKKLGTYKIQNLTTNDSLGNERVVNSETIGKNFTVVNGTLGVQLNSSSSINAGYNRTFNLTFNFNKTFSNPDLTLYVPPNSPGNLNLTPHYLNVSGFSCLGGCDVTTYRGNQSHPIRLSLSFGRNLTNFTLTSSVEAEALVEDTNGMWTLEWHESDYTNTTKVKTPSLNLSKITCSGSQNCTVNQSQAFNLSYNLSNLNSSQHTGKARGAMVYFNNTWNSTENTTSFGNIASNSTVSSPNFQFNISQVGNYTFYFRAWESTKQYNTSREKTVEVKDALAPELLKNYWAQDNLFNRNETVAYRVKASDNQQISDVWLELEKGNYRENVSLNLSTRYTEYDIWKLHYENDTTGRYNITSIYLNDTRNNLNYTAPTGNKSWFRVKKLNLSVSPRQESVVVNNDQVLQANVTGNASAVSSVSASVQKPRNFTESVSLGFANNETDVLKFNGTYSNVTRSGNYTVNISVDLASGISLAETTNFSVPYGNSSIQASNLTLTKDVLKNVTWFLTPENGDLVDLNGSVTIGNTSLLNLASGESPEKKIGNGNVTWEEHGSSARKIVWEINVSDSAGEGNVTLSLNSTLHDLGADRNRTVFIDVIPDDTDKPDIWNVTQQWNVTNLKETNTITVNATDNTTSIDSVKVEMNYPKSGVKNYTASLTPSGLYELDFSNTNETTNSTHRFTYRVYVYDLVGNVTVSGERSFNVTDEYSSLNIERSSNPYIQGENITFKVNVTDVHGNPVKNFNLTMNLSKNGTIERIVEGKITDSGSYQIEVSDAPESASEKEKTVTYALTSVVEKEGNKALKEESFKVTEEIPTVLETPDDNQHIDPGQSVPVKVAVSDPDGYLIKDAAVTATCLKCPNKDYERIEWNSSMGRYYDPAAFKAPEDRTSFSILIHSVDFWKNKGYSYRVPTTEEKTTTTEGTADGGGGDGGGAAALPSIEVLGPGRALPPNTTQATLKVRTESSGSCEFGPGEFQFGSGTSFEQSNGTYHTSSVSVEAGKSYYFLVKCQVMGMVSEKSVAFSVSPKMVEKFRAEFESTALVPRGENMTVYIDLVNEGDKDLTIRSGGRSKCCDLNFETRNVTVRAGARKSVPLEISTPLQTEPRNYTSFLTFETGEVERERILEIRVSEHLLTRKLEEIDRSIPRLREEINGLEEAGMDVSRIREKLNRTESMVKDAKNAVEGNDMNKLKTKINKASDLKNEVKSEVRSLQLQRFLMENKWNIISGLLAFLVGSYLITHLLVPWVRLKNQISDLQKKRKDSVQTRKNAEKQYFRREIDEQTFRDIMTTEQDKILNLRGRINEKKKNLNNLVSRAFSPKRFLLFPYTSSKKAFLKASKIGKREASLRRFISGGLQTTKEGLVEIGRAEIRLFRSFKEKTTGFLGFVRKKISRKPGKEEVKGIKEEVKRPEKKFEEEVEPELEGVEKPEERVSRLTELRRKIEKDKKEQSKL